jgi:hypothetical protein
MLTAAADGNPNKTVSKHRSRFQNDKFVPYPVPTPFIQRSQLLRPLSFRAPAEKSLERRRAFVEIGPPMLDISGRRHAGFLTSFGMTMHGLSRYRRSASVFVATILLTPHPS